MFLLKKLYLLNLYLPKFQMYTYYTLTDLTIKRADSWDG